MRTRSPSVWSRSRRPSRTSARRRSRARPDAGPRRSATSTCSSRPMTRPGTMARLLASLPHEGDESTAEPVTHGTSRASLALREGPQLDIMTAPPGRLGSYLVHFTGSAAHNVRLRQRAKQRGRSLSEHGLIPLDPASPEAAEVPDLETFASEADLYRWLDLEPIEPELREDRGEIEAAADGRLPRLVTRERPHRRLPQPLGLVGRAHPARAHGRERAGDGPAVARPDRPFLEPHDRERAGTRPRRAAAAPDRRAERALRARGRAGHGAGGLASRDSGSCTAASSRSRSMVASTTRTRSWSGSTSSSHPSTSGDASRARS